MLYFHNIKSSLPQPFFFFFVRKLFKCNVHFTGQVSCPALPGRPFICVAPQIPCPAVCPPNSKVCGLRRDRGQLVLGSDGLPLPNCVPIGDAAVCDQINVRPLPANFTGGNGLVRWDPVRLNGTSDDGSNVGSVGEIGSETYAGGPAFFGGNGSDPAVVVKVNNNSLYTTLHVVMNFLQFVVSAVPDSVLQYDRCTLLFVVIFEHLTFMPDLVHSRAKFLLAACFQQFFQ